MWIEKLVSGVIQLDTPIGPRYLQPSFAERALLMWTFRNFPSLPHQVLRASERRLIDRLCAEDRFVSLSGIERYDYPVIGRVERRAAAPLEALPERKPASNASGSVAEQGREAASA